MPTSWNGKTRLILEGIPVWKNGAGELFFYDQDLSLPALLLGTTESGFAADWKERLEERLISYRAAAAPRMRATAPPKKN